MTAVGPQFARFARFSLTGVLGAALQVILFDLLMKCFRLPEVAATPIAVEMVIWNNFFWHERFTWRDRKSVGFRQRAIRLLRFHATNGLVSLAGNALLTYCLVQLFKAPALPSTLAAIAVCAPVNFFLADRWVYGNNCRADPPVCSRPPGRLFAGSAD
jgi:putative flippase GtrA